MGSYWAIHNEDTEEGYNCCEAFNKATEESKTDIIVYSTGDILIEPQLLWRAYGLLLLHDFPVFAYRMDEQGDGSWRENDDALGDFIMIKKEWGSEIGGWNCLMTNWGFMDHEFLVRIGLLLSKESVCLGFEKRDRVKHFYHSRKEDTWYKEQNKINRKIFLDNPLWNKESYEDWKRKILVGQAYL